MKLRALIIEDEKISRDLLNSYLNKYCPNVEVIGMAADAREGLALVRNSTFDILFLDIEMPYGNAFDILESKGTKKFETIFVTAYEKYAIEAINNHAAYYLLKPISIDELIKAVDFVKEKLNSTPNIAPTSRKEPMVKLSIPNQNGVEFVWIKDILYCEANDNYTEIVFEDRKILVSKPLKFYENKLNDVSLGGKVFMRIHRSYLVGLKHVTKYTKGKGGYIEMDNGDKLDVSPKKKADFLSWFSNN